MNYVLHENVDTNFYHGEGHIYTSKRKIKVFHQEVVESLVWKDERFENDEKRVRSWDVAWDHCTEIQRSLLSFWNEQHFGRNTNIHTTPTVVRPFEIPRVRRIDTFYCVSCLYFKSNPAVEAQVRWRHKNREAVSFFHCWQHRGRWFNADNVKDIIAVVASVVSGHICTH